MQKQQKRARSSIRSAAGCVALGLAAALVGLAGFAETASADNHHDPEPSLGSLYSLVDQIGARDLWEQGITGEGVNVAIIDTGVAPVEALTGADKVVAMVDLSFESTVPEAVYLDTYGHGTHVAGIIAGRTPGADPATSEDHPEWFLGVAPDAGIVSVKVGDNSGAVDVSQVIAGVDWVTDHADELDIGVLNLSYASGSSLPYETDPLTYAVERAWNAGIVVVVSAGNDGRAAPALASPARDPYVIAVGAVEAKKHGKFQVPGWASSGDGVRNPDVAAPGAHIESLRVPGGRADMEHPEAYVDEQLFLGSGSSQAAAVVSGAAALILDAHPDLEPDEVKALLMSETAKASPRNPPRSGAGVIQLDDVLDADVPADSAQDFATADGSGSIEAARGSLRVEVNGVPIIGEITVHGTPWVGTSWPGTRWDGTAWAGTAWAGASWTGAVWSGTDWGGAAWNGSSWSGTSWAGTSWADDAWSGTKWTGASWTGTAWAGASWAGTYWGGTSWGGTAWGGTYWGGTYWGGTYWGGTAWGGTYWGGTYWGGTAWGGTAWGGTYWGGTYWGGTYWGGTYWG